MQKIGKVEKIVKGPTRVVVEGPRGPFNAREGEMALKTLGVVVVAF